ncbi:MAG TPA: histidine phosphatase family protein [Blastocatellia bacterium]|nr:histidine phosphatase family protein [Blastocatellia bacterium]
METEGPSIYLVRHGETEWNRERRVQGRQDSPLTALGKIQAARVGLVLKTFDGLRRSPLIISSPLMRAETSARIIGDALNANETNFQVDDRLSEVSAGEWEGLLYTKIETEFPETVEHRRHPEWYFDAPMAETTESAVQRATSFLKSAESYGNIIVVTHRIIGAIIRGTYSGLSTTEALASDFPQESIFQLHNGRISIFDTSAAISKNFPTEWKKPDTASVLPCVSK